LEDGAVYFKNPSFSALVRRFFEKPADADAKRQLQDWLGKYPVHDSYEQVRLLDAQGVTHLSVPDNLGPVSSATVQGASDVLRSGQVAIQDFYKHDQDQHIYLAVLVPILDEQDASRPLGVLVLRIDPEAYLYPFIKRWPTPSRTAETLLVRREGNEVLFLNELRFQSNTALNLRAPLDRAALPAAQAVMGHEGVVEGIDYRGVPVVAALRTIPDSPWSLVTRVDTAEMYGPLREQLMLVVALIGALLVGAGTSVASLWRQQRERYYRERYEAAAALRASEEQYRAIFETASVGIAQCDPRTGQWLRVNEKMCEITGYGADELLRMPISEITHPDDRQADGEAFQRVVQGEQRDYRMEKRYIRKDGSLAWVNVNMTVIRDVAGQPMRTVATIEDITARKRATEALAASEVRYRRLFEAARDGVLILDAETGMIVDVNPFLIELLGVTREVFLGKRVWELGFFKDIVANEANFLELQQKGYVRYENMALEGRDGKRHEVEFVSNVYDVDHSRVIQCNIRDISERKRAEEALRDSEVRMRLATEATGVGIWEWNVPTNRIRWDAQMFRIYGIDPTPDGFVDYSVWTGAVLPEDLHEQEAALQEMVRQLGRSAREFRIRRFHECRRIQSVETALLNARGQAEWVVGTNLDITERKRAEEALRQQNVELQRFNKATVGRELQMVELKQQINELCRHLGQPPRHPLDFLGAKPQPAAAAETVEPKGASSTEADLSEGPDFKANQTNVPSGAPRRAGR
jgi:PAS domain S-box-containing protein